MEVPGNILVTKGIAVNKRDHPFAYNESLYSKGWLGIFLLWNGS